MTELTFLGAAGTVTGSRFLLAAPAGRVLVDCGLFQGLKQLRLRNWAPFPVPPAELAGTVLTHAHLDHSGYLPVLVRAGFHGPVFATPATCDLCRILLLDSGHVQEEEAEAANRHGYSRHQPALPLYSKAEAEASLAQLRPLPFETDARLGGLTFRMRRAGHILGAATVEVRPDAMKLVFSGDLGRPTDPIMDPPKPVAEADYLVVESTYGDRDHPPTDPRIELGEIVRRTAARGGVLVIPAFALGRSQLVLLHLHALRRAGAIPAIPIYMDSPMAASATGLLRAHPGDHRLTSADCADMLAGVTMTGSVEESKGIDRRSGPMVVISASGMATGGRILFHLERFAPDHRNTVLLVGHQAAGTRGDALRQGARVLKIHGRQVPVRAQVATLDGLSAHADASEIMHWLKGFRRPPRTTFVTHGEPRTRCAAASRRSSGGTCGSPSTRSACGSSERRVARPLTPPTSASDRPPAPRRAGTGRGRSAARRSGPPTRSSRRPAPAAAWPGGSSASPPRRWPPRSPRGSSARDRRAAARPARSDRPRGCSRD